MVLETKANNSMGSTYSVSKIAEHKQRDRPLNGGSGALASADGKRTVQQGWQRQASGVRAQTSDDVLTNVSGYGSGSL